MCSDSTKLIQLANPLTGLNPTLDWICALTILDGTSKLAPEVRLNPTLDWICALTDKILNKVMPTNMYFDNSGNLIKNQ